MIGVLARRAGRALDALLPVACVCCARGVERGAPPLCALCASRLPRLPRPRCERCAEPLGSPPRGAPFRRCGMCEEWGGSLVAAAAPCAFTGVAARLVRALKYGGWTSVAPGMAGAMLPEARALLDRLGWEAGSVPVVPVPLSPSRRRERGFNQAELLARPLAAALGARLEARLVRTPGGRRQAGLGGDARASNVAGRFVSRPGAGPAAGAVLLVDDVSTTGATARACAEALREAGFERAALVTFARTPRPPEGR